MENDKYRSAYNTYTKKLIQSFTLTINKNTLTKESGLKSLFCVCVEGLKIDYIDDIYST